MLRDVEHSLLAQATNPDASVFAFELVERVHHKLVRNVELNGYDVTCINKAASNADRETIIYDTTGPHTYSVAVNMNRSNHPDAFPVEIETITLNTLVCRVDLRTVDLIKIDVEVHETEVLEGLAGHPQRSEPSLFVEVLNDEVSHRVAGAIAGLDSLYLNIDQERGAYPSERLAACASRNALSCTRETASALCLVRDR